MPLEQSKDISLPPAQEAFLGSEKESVSKDTTTLSQIYSEPNPRPIIDPGTPEGKEELDNSNHLDLHIIDPGTPEGEAELALLG